MGLGDHGLHIEPEAPMWDQRTGKLVEDVASARADAMEDATRKLVGLTFRGTIEVKVRRPRWMPDRVYRYLMRTIVVVEHRSTA